MIFFRKLECHKYNVEPKKPDTKSDDICTFGCVYCFPILLMEKCFIVRANDIFI